MFQSPFQPSRRSPLHALGAAKVAKPAARLPWRGVNLAGPEFGELSPYFSNTYPGVPGEDYFFNSRRTYNLLGRMGFRVFRVPFRWERLQPTLGGGLDPDHVQALRTQASLARAVGGRVILDCHNYGRYRAWVDESAVEWVLDAELDGAVPLEGEHLADLWARISRAFSGEAGVMCYGLMNEPHDMGTADWHAISARTVEAIRSEGDSTPVLVSGERWGSASKWPWVNPPEPWIDPSGGRVLYEAHCYLDHDGSGKYQRSFAEESAEEPAIRERVLDLIEPFLDWLRRNEVEGVVGELGIPVHDPDWLELLRPLLSRMDEAGVPALLWAAGEAWGDYPLSLQPREGEEAATPLVEAFLEGKRLVP